MVALNLNNVLVGSDKPERLIAFYSEVLGPPSWEGGGYVAWSAGHGYLCVGPGAVAGRSDEPERVVIGFQAEDVLGEFERIRAAGGEVVRAPFHPVDGPDDWLAVIADPDGNLVQIGSPWAPTAETLSSGL